MTCARWTDFEYFEFEFIDEIALVVSHTCNVCMAVFQNRFITFPAFENDVGLSNASLCHDRRAAKIKANRSSGKIANYKVAHKTGPVCV